MIEAMLPVQITLFGEPRVTRGHQVMVFTRRKAMALIAFLAVSESPCGRERLAAMLWPEVPTGRSLANLRNVIYSIRRTAGDDLLEGHGTDLQLVSTAIVDVRTFRRHIRNALDTGCIHGTDPMCSRCLDGLAQAVAMASEPFLAGFAVRDSAEFEQWQMFETQSLQHLYRRALCALLDIYETRDDPSKAIDYGRQLVAADPLDEGLHRRLMQIYARAGRRSEALRQFDDCARILRDDLDVAPDTDTIELAESIRGGTIPAQRYPDPGVAPLHDSREPPEIGTITGFPCPATVFIGRRHELNQLQSLIADSAHRLMTLAGPGGAGKTRLAIAAAQDARRFFRDGIAWVSLAAVDAPDAIFQAIARSLNLSVTRTSMEQGPLDSPDLFRVRDQVVLYLKNRRMLLILDNFEHLIDKTQIIQDLLEQAPEIRCLVTSRRRLGLQAETVFEVAGLNVSAIPGNMDASSDAVKLFVQSARHANAAFRLNAGNREAVRTICRILDGLPLAIELAAGWIRLFDPHIIVKEIQRDPDFLASTLRDIPARHRTIRGVFDQTWSMLSENAGNVFLNLSPLRGGFDWAAASTVAGATYSILGELIDASIVRRTTVNRFAVHEVLRQYAERRLDACPDKAQAVRGNLAAYYLDFVANQAVPLRRIRQKEAVSRLAADIGNIRTAWQWSAEHHDVTRMLRAAPTVFLYFDLRYLFEEGMLFFRNAGNGLDVFNDDPCNGSTEHAGDDRLLAGLITGMYAWFMRYSKSVSETSGGRRGIHAEAAMWAQRANAFLSPFPNSYEWALIRLLTIYMNREWEIRDVSDDLDRCLVIFNTSEDNWAIAWLYHTRGCSLWDSDPERSEATQRECLDIRRRYGDTWGTAISYMVLSHCARRRRSLEEAGELLKKSYSIHKSIAMDSDGLIETLEKLGGVALEMGDHDRAIAYCEEALAMSRKMSNVRRTAFILGSIGQAYAKTGQRREAMEYLNQCLSLCRQSDFPDLAARFSKILAKLTEKDGSGTILRRR